jgi:hypothetical protein
MPFRRGIAISRIATSGFWLSHSQRLQAVARLADDLEVVFGVEKRLESHADNSVISPSTMRTRKLLAASRQRVSVQ